MSDESGRWRGILDSWHHPGEHHEPRRHATEPRDERRACIPGLKCLRCGGAMYLVSDSVCDSLMCAVCHSWVVK